MYKPSHKLKSSRLFIAWIISYLSVFIIPLLILSLYYSHVFLKMKEEAMTRHHLALENVTAQLNSDINDLLRISTNLQMNQKVNSLSYKNRDYPELPLLINELYNELSVFMVTNSIIKEINIYFPGNGYIVSSSTAYQDFYTDYMPSRYIPLTHWRQIQKTLNPDNFDLSFAGRDNSQLLFSRVLLYSNRREAPLSLIVFEIDVNRLLTLLNGYVASSDFSELAVAGRGDVLVSTGKGDINRDRNSRSHIEDGIDLVLPDLRLVSSTEKRLIFADQSRMISILIISIIISLLLGLILTYYNAVRNYRPLDEIIASINRLPGKHDQKNEYEKIQTVIKENSEELEKQRRILRNSYIFKLLTGEAQYGHITSNIASEFDLEFSEDRSYVVVLRHPREVGGTQAFAIASRDLGDRLEPRFSKLYFCRNQDTIAVIVNASGENDGELKECVDSFVTHCGETLNIAFRGGISELCPNTKLSEAYTQSMNALEYIHLFNKGRVLAYGKIHKESQIGYINLKTFDYLINLVMTGNGEGLDSYFTKLKNQYSERELSTADAKGTLYFFYNVTMRLKAQLQYQYSYKKLADIFRLNNNFFTFPLSEAVDYIESLYRRAVDLINESSNEGIDMILQEISQYIERNYFDSNLNLNTIASHFGITPSYLSKKYRVHYGYTINDYLYQTGISHALELQENTELKIAQIARMIGFQNSNAFIRIYKKYRGCTPGQYRAGMHSPV